MKVKCPKCGEEFNILASGRAPNPKGAGKRTAKQQTRLSQKQVECLEAVRWLNAVSMETAVPARSIYERLKQVAEENHTRFPSTAFVAFWMSALLGAGFVAMGNKKCEVRDFPRMEIRFVKKPVWYLSQAYQSGTLKFDADGFIVRVGLP